MIPGVDDRRKRRMAQNEALARRINDRIEYQRPRNGESADSFICECVRVDCGGVLDLSIGEYARVQSHPRRFVVLPPPLRTDGPGVLGPKRHDSWEHSTSACS